MAGDLPELEALLRERLGAVRKGVTDVASAAVRGVSRDVALARLAKAITETNTLAHLLGMRRVLMAADAALPRGEKVKADVPTQLPRSRATGAFPRVTFDEAVSALVNREPRLAEVIDGLPKYKHVQQIYREGGFSAARAADQSIVSRVQVEIAKGVQQGESLAKVRANVQRATGNMADWTDAYTENVIKTNINGAHADGTIEQTKDPAVARVIPALRYDAVLDGDARPNHAALDGMVLPVGDPRVERYKPPNGYQCRCKWTFLNRNQLRRLDLLNEDGTARAYIPPAVLSGRGGPDEGFTK